MMKGSCAARHAALPRLVALLTILLLLSACQTGKPAKIKTTPPPTDVPAPKPLRIANVGGPAEKAAMKFVVESYQKGHPDRPVQLVDATAQFRIQDTTAADGGGVDIIPFIGYGQAEQVLVDLQPYAATSHFDESIYGELLSNRKVKGALYGVPFTVNPFVLAINVDAFARAGVPVPADGWTWDEFRVALANLTRAHGRPALEVILSIVFIQIYMEQLTGRPVGEVEEKEVASALAYFDTLVNQDKSMIPTPVRGKSGTIMVDYRSFAAQETFVSLQEYHSGVTQTFDFNWQYLPVPAFKPENRLTATMTVSLGVSPKIAVDPAQAWDFIQYATSDEIAVGLAAQGIMPARVIEPVREAVMASVKPGSPLSTLVKMRYSAMIENNNQGRYMTSTLHAGDLVLSGLATVDEAMETCRKLRAQEASRK